jgi:hypothetical protein
MTFPFSSYETRDLVPAATQEPARDGEGGVDCWLCSTGRGLLRGTFLGV